MQDLTGWPLPDQVGTQLNQALVDNVEAVTCTKALPGVSNKASACLALPCFAIAV